MWGRLSFVDDFLHVSTICIETQPSLMDQIVWCAFENTIIIAEPIFEDVLVGCDLAPMQAFREIARSLIVRSRSCLLQSYISAVYLIRFAQSFLNKRSGLPKEQCFELLAFIEVTCFLLIRTSSILNAADTKPIDNARRAFPNTTATITID